MRDLVLGELYNEDERRRMIEAARAANPYEVQSDIDDVLPYYPWTPLERELVQMEAARGSGRGT